MKNFLANLFTDPKDRKIVKKPLLVQEKPNYSDVIEEIHNAFNNEGDILLSQAKKLLESLTIKDEAKSKQLKDLGFASTKEVSAMNSVELQKRQQQLVADAIMEAKVQYPTYRFITEESAERIAKKYGLVLGTVSQYKGFVPQKNLDEISRFFENHPQDKYSYYQTGGWNPYSMGSMEISKENYDFIKENRVSSHVFKAQTILNICAPVSDMNIEGHEVKGWKLVKMEVPDPIVMRKKSFNGVAGYIIITAWGDEASDPEVINHSNN